jgi:hypothetical protein
MASADFKKNYHTVHVKSFKTTCKQAGSKFVTDNENQFHSISSKRKSKIFTKIISFVFVSANYYLKNNNFTEIGTLL